MFYYIQEGINHDNILRYVCENKPNNIYIVSDTEWAYLDLKQEFIDELNQHTKINLLFGSYDCQWYKDYYKNINIVFWNTFWFNWGEMCLRGTVNYKNINYTNFNKPYICLNNKSNILRCALIDNLAKHNYIEKGNVTWNKFIEFKEGYQLKYYDDSFRALDDDFLKKQDSFIICKEFYTSLFHIVGESTNHVPFITEKTVIPILLKKPFVTLGCKGFNKKLKELGFELFDELIDYRFDDEENVARRGEILIDSISDIVNCSNLNALYKKLYPKIEHNYNLAQSIIHNINYIPDIVKERVRYIKSINKVAGPVESRWDYFIQNAVEPKINMTY